MKHYTLGYRMTKMKRKAKYKSYGQAFRDKSETMLILFRIFAYRILKEDMVIYSSFLQMWKRKLHVHHYYCLILTLRSIPTLLHIKRCTLNLLITKQAVIKNPIFNHNLRIHILIGWHKMTSP